MKNLCYIEVTPEISPLVQKILFECGYSWTGEKRVKHVDSKYICPWTDSNLCYSDRITKREAPVISAVDAILYFTGKKKFEDCIRPYELNFNGLRVKIKPGYFVEYRNVKLDKNIMDKIIQVWNQQCK